jgi:hypothetical protein
LQRTGFNRGAAVYTVGPGQNRGASPDLLKDGETDMLMRDSNNGALEVYDIANETDMLMRNVNTGAFELCDISKNAITSMGPMGQVGPEWSVSGIAANSISAAPAAQLAQAMAAFTPSDGALANVSVLGQQPASSMAAGLLATPGS